MVRRGAVWGGGGRRACENNESALIPFKCGGEPEVDCYFGAEEVYGGTSV